MYRVWIVDKKIVVTHGENLSGELVYSGEAWDAGDAIHRAFIKQPRIDPVTKTLRGTLGKKPNRVPAGVFRPGVNEGAYYSADGNIYKAFIGTAQVFAAAEDVELKILE